jgi:hypothetical protein
VAGFPSYITNYYNVLFESLGEKGRVRENGEGKGRRRNEIYFCLNIICETKSSAQVRQVFHHAQTCFDHWIPPTYTLE